MRRPAQSIEDEGDFLADHEGPAGLPPFPSAAAGTRKGWARSGVAHG